MCAGILFPIYYIDQAPETFSIVFQVVTSYIQAC
jgi:hypothetical protein